MSLEFIVPCHSCGEPSVKLCDFIIGWPIDTFERKGKISDERWRATIKGPPFTCDRPLCLHCAVFKGNIFLDGENYHEVDSFDRCPEHANADDQDAPAITEAEADVTRKRLRLRMAT